VATTPDNYYPLFNNTGTSVVHGELVRASGSNGFVRAQANNAGNVQGLLGANGGGTVGPGGTTNIFTSGARVDVLMEPGLTLVVGQTIWVSASVAGRGTNVQPGTVAVVGTIETFSAYAATGIVTVALSIGAGGGGGAQGAQGFQGSAGAQGAQGFQGTQGAGAQGAQGSTGAQGATGAQGTQGATGNINMLTSVGNTIAITNPTGPTTDLAVIQQPAPSGLAAFNSTVVRSDHPGGTAVSVLGAGDSLMAGVTTGHANDGRHSLMYRVFSNVATQAASKAPGGYVTKWCQGAGLLTPTYINSAVPGSDTSTALANVNAYLITPLADGNVVLTNWGVNDQIHSIPLGTTSSNVTAIATAFFAARPNSKLIWIPALWNGSQAWNLDTFGRPQGNGSNDAGLRAINQAIATALAPFPNAQFLGQLYYDVWADIAKNNSPAGSTAVVGYTQDFIHPSARGVAVAGRSFFRLICSAGSLFPSFLQQASQSDYSEGDWYAAQKETVEGGWTNHTIAFGAAFSYNRDRRFDMSSVSWLALSNVAAASIEGGGIICSAPDVTLFSQTLYQNPGGAGIAIAIDFQFPALAAGRKGFVGLFDSLATGAGAGSCMAIGIDQTASTNFQLKIRNAGGADGVYDLAFPADNARHTGYILWDGNVGSISTGILQIIVDGKEALLVNPVAIKMPVVPLAFGAGLVASGGSPTIAKAIVLYNEAEPF